MNLSTPFHESVRSALPYQQLVGSKFADKWQKAYLDIRDTEAGRIKEEVVSFMGMSPSQDALNTQSV